MKKQNGLTKKVLFSLLAAGVMSGFAAGGVSAANVIGTVKVGGEEITVDTPTGTATVGEAGKTLSIENSKDDAVGLFGKSDNLTLKGSEITITSTAKSGVGIDVGSSKQTESPYATVTVGDSDTNKISVNTSYTGIQAIRGHLTLNAKEVDVTSTGDFAVWLQNNTETEKAPDGASSIDITADTVNLKGAAGGVVVFSNGQLNITGDTTIDGGSGAALDVRGNSMTNINTDGKHTTVIKGDIVFETPNTQQDAQNSGQLVNANVNLNLSGEGSSWTGSAYQEFKDVPHGTAISGNNEYYGDVTGLSVALSNGATWTMTDSSFVNKAEVGGKSSINVNSDVEVFNAGEVDLNGGTLDAQGGTTTINTLNADKDSTVSLSNATLNVAGGDATIGTFNATNGSSLNLSGDADVDIQGGEADLEIVTTSGTSKLNIGAKAKVAAKDGFKLSGNSTMNTAVGSVVTGDVYTDSNTKASILGSYQGTLREANGTALDNEKIKEILGAEGATSELALTKGNYIIKLATDEDGNLILQSNDLSDGGGVLTTIEMGTWDKYGNYNANGHNITNVKTLEAQNITLGKKDLQTTLNDMDDDIEDLETWTGKGTTLTNKAGNLAAGVNKNTEDISALNDWTGKDTKLTNKAASLAEGVNTNTANITQNAADIKTNQENITGLKTWTGDGTKLTNGAENLAAGVNQNTEDINTNKTNIGALETWTGKGTELTNKATSLAAGVNANTTKIEQEVKDREGKDALLEQSIKNEKEAREAAVTNLQGADANLQTAINNEEKARAGADDVLNGKITNEEKARELKDDALQKQITDNKTDIGTNTTAIKENTKNIGTNTTDINELKKWTGEGTDLDNGAENLAAGVNANTTKIDEEAEERKTEDQKLQNQIDQNKTDISALKKWTGEVAELDNGAETLADGVNKNTEKINQEIKDRQDADKKLQANIDAEATARQNADDELQKNINTEKDERVKADKKLQDNIDAEKAAREEAVKGLQNGINDEAAEREKADMAEKEAREAADDQLQDNIDAEKDARKDADDQLQKNIDAEEKARKNADDQLQKNINAEEDARKNADDQLQKNIDAEKDARKDADDQLQKNIDAEEKARKNADDQLQKNINAEEDARKNADDQLQKNIDAEAAARDVADKALQANIDKEAETRDAADQAEAKARADADQAEAAARDAADQAEAKARADADQEEAAARDAADKVLQANIDKEAETRETADKTLQENIDNEAAARIAGDTALNSRINQVEKDATKGIAKASALAALHPLDYDPNNKFDIAAAGGFYKGENAFALGAFYRPNRNVMFSLGTSLSSGDNAYNVGVSVKLGHAAEVRRPSEGTVSDILKDIQELKAKQAQLEKENEELKAQLAALGK